MVFRPTSKSAKSCFFFICVFVIFVLCVVYFYLMYAQENFKNVKWAEKRCLLELSSVKYQLDVLTDYKVHVEKLLSESQKAHSMDKDKFKDVAESCITMKQQSLLCQNQFDDLQSECKKVRETYNRKKIDAEQLQEQLQEATKIKEEAQRTTDELFAEIDILRKTNKNLQDQLQSPDRIDESPVFEGDFKPVNVKTFSIQKEVSPGVYEVGKSTGTIPETAVKEKVAESPGEHVNNLERRIEEPLNHVPPGFAPVLRVVESAESVNLQKPPDVLKGDFAAEKPEERKEPKVHDKVVKSDDRDMELVGPLPEAHYNAILDENRGLQIPPQNLPLLDDANIGHEQNRPVQEDDDEGEEYAA